MAGIFHKPHNRREKTGRIRTIRGDLIGPRRHIRSINDMTDADQGLVAYMLAVGRDVAREREIGASGYKLVFNVEWGGGQRIFHLHMHLLGGWKK